MKVCKIELLDKLNPRKKGKAVIEDCPLQYRPHLYSCSSCQWYGGLRGLTEVLCKHEPQH